MIPRILWIAGLTVAMLASADQASAQPPRFSTPIDNIPVTNAGPLKQVTYAVADLVHPIPSLPDLEVVPLPSRSGEEFAGAKTGVRQAALTLEKTTEASLIDHLLTKVAPSSWIVAGGPGTIQYLPESNSLIVSQTARVHQEIAAALAALRDQQELEVVLHCRIIQVPVKALERTQKAMNLDCLEQKTYEEKPAQKDVVPGRGIPWTNFLNKEQVRQFLDLVMKEPTSKVNQRAIVSTFAGKNAALETLDHTFYLTGVELNRDKGQMFFSPRNQPITNGLRLALRADVSADHRFLRLKINGYWSQLVGPVPLIPMQIPVPQIIEGPGNATTTLSQPTIFQMFLQQPTFGQIRFNQQISIPDGGTTLLHGGIVPCKVTRKDRAAWLSNLITGDELTTWEDHHILLMVTSRIVDRQGDERQVRMSSAASR